MNVLRLNDSISLTLDLAGWMAQTGRFNDIRASEGREWIQATCPYHDDRHASFAVNSDSGVFKCQACGASGNFVQLVKHVEEHDTAYDAEQSLIARFARFVPATDEALDLEFDDGEEETFVTLMPTFPRNGAYLNGRGITDETQATFGVLYDPTHKAMMFAWTDAKDSVVTFKYRSVVDKRFWYDPPVTPGRLKRILYGFHLAKTSPLIVVCEGEIDAMSVAQAGFSAVALGGANLSLSQATLLRNSTADEICVFTDNDVAGRKARAAIVDAMLGHKRVSVVDWSNPPIARYKDANEILVDRGDGTIRAMIDTRIPVGLSLSMD